VYHQTPTEGKTMVVGEDDMLHGLIDERSVNSANGAKPETKSMCTDVIKISFALMKVEELHDAMHDLPLLQQLACQQSPLNYYKQVSPTGSLGSDVILGKFELA
jgi:hypothetical protein